MRYESDPRKERTNLSKHGLSFAEAEYFEWETALDSEDVRKRYTEQRFKATGYIGDRLHVMIYCKRAAAIRIISLRKANAREMKHYAKT